MDVSAPDGGRWSVSRRWLPWRPRRRRIDREHVQDALEDLSLGDEPAVLLLVGSIGLFVLALPLLLVLGLLAVEIALVLLLLPLVTVGRALLVGRWPLDVRRDDVLVHSESVRGWRASARRRAAIVEAIRRGDPDPTGGVASS